MFVNIVLMGFMAGIVPVLFYTPYLYAKAMLILNSSPLSQREKVLCVIPIVNLAVGERAYTGKMGKTLIALLVFVFAMLLRMLAIFLLPSNALVQISTLMLLLVSVLLLYLANVYRVFIVINDSCLKPLSATLFYAVLFPLGDYYIGKDFRDELALYGNKQSVFKV